MEDATNDLIIKDLEAENARLKEELAKAKEERDATRVQLEDADMALMKKGIFREEVHVLHESLAKTKEAGRELRETGDHRTGCQTRAHTGPIHSCSCGWTQVLASTAEVFGEGE